MNLKVYLLKVLITLDLVNMDLIDLIVYICSDGTIMAYNKDGTLNNLFTDLHSWSMLHKIYKLNIKSSKDRKGMNKDENIKYVNYYFKETSTGQSISIPLSHVAKMLQSIKE